MNHEILERMNAAKSAEARRMGVHAAALPEKATDYRKSRGDYERHARMWIRDCSSFREAHFGDGTGQALRLLLEEAFYAGSLATSEIAALRETWAREDTLRDAERRAGQVVLLERIEVMGDDGNLRWETTDETAARSVKAAHAAMLKVQRAMDEALK